VGLVLGVDVRLLEDQPDRGRRRRVDPQQLFFGFRVQVSGSWFRVHGFGAGLVPSSCFRISVLAFWVQDFGYRVSV
jgi:hypothetical protein